MSTSLSAGASDLPCFHTYFLWSLIELEVPNFSLYLFCNIIMTGELVHTALKETVVPDLLFSSERLP